MLNASYIYSEVLESLNVLICQTKPLDLLRDFFNLICIIMV